MLTLQRSPRILCAEILKQVNFDEDPSLTDLGTGDFPGSGLLSQRDRVDRQ